MYGAGRKLGEWFFNRQLDLLSALIDPYYVAE